MLLHLRYFCPLQILCKSSAEFVPALYSGGVAAGVHLETWYKLVPPKTVEIDSTFVPTKQLPKTNTILFLNYLGGVPVNYLGDPPGVLGGHTADYESIYKHTGTDKMVQDWYNIMVQNATISTMPPTATSLNPLGFLIYCFWSVEKVRPT